MLNLKINLFIPLLFAATFIFGQNNILKGKIISSKNNLPLRGATISLKGTNISSISSEDGSFTLGGSSQGDTLVVSHAGYLIKEVPTYSGNQFLNISLEENPSLLEDVVVIGYGTQKRKYLTGAITSVTSKELQSSANPSIGQMVQGKAAGLQVIQNSAQPGGGLTFNIRGFGSINASNDPLIVIDGYPITNDNNEPNAAESFFQGNGSKATALNSINPADIESIEVLKDASATSIYGSRAGHGVILITTKKGKEGNVNVNYSNSFGVQKAYGVPVVLNGKQFLTEVNKALYENWLRDNDVIPYGDKQPSDISNAFAPRYTQQEIDTAGAGTNWFKEISRNGFIQQHNLSLNGGTSKIKYLISGNLFDQKGIIRTNDFKRHTARANLDFNFNKYLRAGIRTSGSVIKNNNVNLATNYDEGAGIILTAMQFNPSLPVRDQEGKYSVDTYAPTLENPVSVLEMKNITTNKRLLANGFIEIEPIENLVAKITLGMDYSAGTGVSYAPTTTRYGARFGGRAGQSLSENYNYQYDFTLNYKRVFAKNHSFDILGGGAYQKFKYNGFSAANSKFITDILLWNNIALGEASRPTVNSFASSSETASLFGRISYDYDKRYLFTATVRYDGSSDFAESHKWALFPSVAFAWRPIAEKFLENQNIFSDLKFRVSYGKTGNQGIGGRAFPYYGIGYQYAFNNSINTGVALEQLANPDLKWETTTETNFGIDLGFLKDRISITGEYFKRITSDLLSFRTLPYFQQINRVWANIGATQSSGVELTLKTVNIQKQNLMWNTSISFSHYTDSWKERDPKWVPSIYESYNDPLRTIFTYVSDGIIRDKKDIPQYMPFATVGQIKLKDINGYKLDANGVVMYDANNRAMRTGSPDGILDDADQVRRFVNNPYLLGVNNSVTFHDFDISVYIYTMFNRMNISPWDVILLTPSNRLQNNWNMLANTLDRWTYENPGGKYNSAVQGSYSQGDYYLQNTSFIRVQNIILGYTLPRKKMIFKSFRIFMEATNPLLFTKYKGSDPETDFQSSGPYPNQRTFSTGVNITF